MFNRDRLFNASQFELSKAAFSALAALQDSPREVMVGALGVLLEVTSERFKLSPSEVMTAAANLCRETGDPKLDQYMTALRSFVREELT